MHSTQNEFYKYDKTKRFRLMKNNKIAHGSGYDEKKTASRNESFITYNVFRHCWAS